MHEGYVVQDTTSMSLKVVVSMQYCCYYYSWLMTKKENEYVRKDDDVDAIPQTIMVALVGVHDEQQ